MDGPATHLPQLLKHPGGAPLSSTRCAHATLPLDWNLSTPLDQDLFELINRLQSSRLGKNLYSLYTLIFFSLKYTHYCHAPQCSSLYILYSCSAAKILVFTPILPAVRIFYFFPHFQHWEENYRAGNLLSLIFVAKFAVIVIREGWAGGRLYFFHLNKNIDSFLTGFLLIPTCI